MRKMTWVLLLLLAAGCGGKTGTRQNPAPPISSREEEERQARQLLRAHHGLEEYSAWRARWFSGKPYWENQRPFRGGPADVPQALTELDAIIIRWGDTPAGERALRMQRLIQRVQQDGVQGKEFEERMSWVCKEEARVIMESDE